MENIISTLMNFEDIKFNAGNNKTDVINVGQILAQYLTEGVGSRAYQDFNILLNETLSMVGSLDLKKKLEE